MRKKIPSGFECNFFSKVFEAKEILLMFIRVRSSIQLRMRPKTRFWPNPKNLTNLFKFKTKIE